MEEKCHLRILFVGLVKLWQERGDSIHFRAIAEAMRKRGNPSWFLCLSGPKAPDISKFCEVHIPVLEKRFLRQLTWNIFGIIPAIIMIYKYRINIIYSRPAKGAIVSWLASKLTGKPLVIEINGLATEDLKLYRPHGFLLLKMSRFWENLMYRSAKMIVAAPGYVKYLNEEFKIPLDKFCVSSLGVDTDLFFPRSIDCCQSKLGLEPTPTVVWVGNMVLWQGLQYLIRAVPIVRKSVPNVQFLVIGDGPDRLECERLVKKLQVEEAVHFLGNVPHKSVPEYIDAGNVCVAMFPGNRGRKGTISALKTISYLACARPVVTTEMDEMAEIIQEKGAGFMVPPDDPPALAYRVVEILTEQQGKWLWRCKQAAILAANSGNWDSSANRIASRLMDIVK